MRPKSRKMSFAGKDNGAVLQMALFAVTRGGVGDYTTQSTLVKPKLKKSQ